MAEGLVTAKLTRNSATEVVAGSLRVDSRAWKWSEGKVDPSDLEFIEGAGDKCGTWGALRVDRHGNPESVDLSLLTHIPEEVPCGVPYQFFLLPDIEGEDGFEFDRVLDSGPNDGLYYVTGGSWYVTLGSTINPYIQPGGPQEALPKKRAQEPCEGDLSPPSLANFYEFNVFCFGIAPVYDAFIDALWLHEGVGSRGLDAVNPNGHWARIRRAATLPAGDPYNVMEPVVDTDPFDLLDSIEEEVKGADGYLALEADQGHAVVRDNWQPCQSGELINIYDSDQQEYDYLLFVEVAAAGGQLCP